MEDRKTTIEKKIFDDLQKAIWDYYKEENISYKHKQSALDTIHDFLLYRSKLIPVCNRKVFYSKELLSKISNNELQKEHVKILEEYKEGFKNGRDMNIFLSNNIKKTREIDFLLTVWHLYHLHMSGKFVENKEQMKNNRSDTQLLCIISPTAVYFVDVIPHPKKSKDYFDRSHLKIVINNNWEELIGLYLLAEVVPGTINFTVSSPEDIYQLYVKCGVNISFELEGKIYMLARGITAARTPLEITSYLEEINKRIKLIASRLKEQDEIYKGIKLSYDNAKVLTCSVILGSQPIRIF